MKKILMISLACILLLLCISCGNNGITTINVENSETLHNTILGIEALIEINDSMYYDSTTRIVYWWNGYLNSNWGTTPTPYYSPNGLMYKYNPETNTLEEITSNKEE